MGTFLNAGSEFLINNGYVDEGQLAGRENLANGGEDYTGVPQAYLNYILFDKEYNVIEGKKLQISEAGKFEIGYTELGPHEHLQIDPITIAKEGYIYIYLSNQTPGSEVYSPARRSARLSTVGGDDLLITHTQGRVVQKDDYYPFGLTFNTSKRENTLANKFTFQGQELQDDFGLNWYSFKWRNHMPEIGRFFNVDPLASDYVHNSTYAFSENKVTNHIELEGLEAVSAQLEVRGLAGGKIGVTTSHTAGIIVGRSTSGSGVHVAGFYTPTLGIGGGQGLTAGVSTSFYPRASIENLGGWGAAAGYFLTANPAGVGPVFAGEINSTNPTEANINLGGTIGINPLSVGLGGGIYAEVAYTFLSDVVNIGDLANSSLIQQLSETFGVSVDVIIQGVNALSGELKNLTENQMIDAETFDFSKGHIVPSDNTRVSMPQRVIIEEEIK